MRQPTSRDMETGGMNTHPMLQQSHSQVSMEELHQQQNGQQQYHDESQNSQNHDDFLEQILFTIPNCSWPPQQQDLPSSNPNAALKSSDSPPEEHGAAAFQYPFDEASKLRQQQQLNATKALLMQQQQLLLSQGLRPPSDPGMLSNLPLNQQQFHPPPPQSFGAQTGAVPNQPPPASASTGGSSGGGAAPQRQRVRARRGQATDPHSIAERLRRERIAERMKALQELVPNANKTDKASMLDEIIDYVKFLQLQVKVLSMSRLGGAGAGAPQMLADLSSEGGVGRSSNGNQTAPTNDSMTVTEHQVAKMMEEDMGSAMQYLQGKGLCLMPISLATAISTATCRNPLPPTRPHINHHISNNNNGAIANGHALLPPNVGEEGASSPNMSGLTIQSATAANPTAVVDTVKDVKQ